MYYWPTFQVKDTDKNNSDAASMFDEQPTELLSQQHAVTTEATRNYEIEYKYSLCILHFQCKQYKVSM